jgi:hypothetical protein
MPRVLDSPLSDRRKRSLLVLIIRPEHSDRRKIQSHGPLGEGSHGLLRKITRLLVFALLMPAVRPLLPALGVPLLRRSLQVIFARSGGSVVGLRRLLTRRGLR